MCVEALLVVWSDLSERARKVLLTFVYLWKSLWVTLIAIGFVLVFKAQLSGAKFYGLRRSPRVGQEVLPRSRPNVGSFR